MNSKQADSRALQVQRASGEGCLSLARGCFRLTNVWSIVSSERAKRQPALPGALLHVPYLRSCVCLCVWVGRWGGWGGVGWGGVGWGGVGGCVRACLCVGVCVVRLLSACAQA